MLIECLWKFFMNGVIVNIEMNMWDWIGSVELFLFNETSWRIAWFIDWVMEHLCYVSYIIVK